jgi:hypothetical protein
MIAVWRHGCPILVMRSLHGRGVEIFVAPVRVQFLLKVLGSVYLILYGIKFMLARLSYSI